MAELMLCLSDREKVQSAHRVWLYRSRRAVHPGVRDV